MSDISASTSPELIVPPRRPASTLKRVTGYVFIRLLTLALVVVVSVLITIYVANLGGFLDTVLRANIDESIGFMIKNGWLRDVEDQAEREVIIAEARANMEKAAGLDSPFLVRTAGWLWKGLTLDWGKARPYITAQGTQVNEVRNIIRDFLPRTLLVFGSANLALFFTTVLLALGLSRRYGAWQDKLVTALAPLASAPSWVYGLILAGFTIHVFRNTAPSFDNWLPEFKLEYLPFYIKVMAPPALAIFLSKFFQSLYAWRTIYLVNSREDFVEIGRAKGLPPRIFENRYILRPVLPNVLTSFALLLVGLWQEVIVLESIFNVAGIGLLFRIAVGMFDVRMIVALVVTFAYMLAITVFLLDISYAFADPRISVGGLGQSSQPVTLSRPARRPGLFRRSAPPLYEKAATMPAAHPSHAPPDMGETRPLVLSGLLLFDSQASDRGREENRELLQAAETLAEAGVLLFASDALWLTRAELQAAVFAWQNKRPVQPLNRIVHERRRTSRQLRLRTTQQLPSYSNNAATVSLTRAVLTALQWMGSLPRRANGWLRKTQPIRRYPGAALGVSIILFLVAVSIFTMLAYPYNTVVRAWRGDNFRWLRNPAYAQPAWVNLFRREKLPGTISLRSSDPAAQRSERGVSATTREISFSFPFDFTASDYPSDLILFFASTFSEKKPLVAIKWVTPDGRSVDLGSFSISSSYSYYVFNDERLLRKLNSLSVYRGLFGEVGVTDAPPLKGRYELQVTAFVFDQEADVSADFVLYGKVFGLAGTDGRRRDSLLALLWGTPVALSFGLLAAASTTLITIFLAGVSAWFGGWLDDLIQRLTEVNMILPFFPVILMVYTLYSKSFWVLMGMTVLLSVFGSSIKNYRSLFLQIKELPYFEAARAYGAGNWRIIFRYLIPRVGAIIIPQMVVLVPSYVFLEASLAVLGLYDPLTPPTWGQLILEGLTKGIGRGAYHLVYAPAVMLMLTGYAFLLLGSSLERVFEPRLKER